MASSSKKKLVIVESPGKIKKLSSFLGSGYVVKASFGHVMDLPRKGLNIDIKNDFEPTYEVMPKKKDVIKDLKKVAKDCNEIYLAADQDREGSFISWSLYEALPKTGHTFYRVTFDSITKSAVQKAFQNPKQLSDEEMLVEAQKSRRLLDRIVGFKITPLLWKGGKNTSKGPARSAGRVQSVGLRMIVERHKEIEAFVPQKYWTVEAEVSGKSKDHFVVNLVTKDKLSINSEEMADKIVDTLNKYDFVVESVDKKKGKSSPQAPFVTSTLQQAASSALNWGSKKTMSVAQSLYEAGLITYMRTDSPTLSKEATTEIRTLIPTISSKQYLPAKAPVYKAKKAGNAQEAHEAVRPTNLTDDLPDVLKATVDPDQKKLLELIWRRTIASQTSPAQFDKVEILVKCGKYKLKAIGQTQSFDGFLKFWTYSKSKENILPEIKAKEKLDKHDVSHKEHETKPPARYNEASLIKELEANGVGRPSTYSSIIETLKAREYVEMDGKAFMATDDGIEVSDFLTEHFDKIINVEYTSKLEDALDEVANGDKTRIELLNEFWKELKAAIDAASIKLKTNEVSPHKCLACGEELFVRMNRKTKEKFLVCSQKSCSKTFNMDDDEKPVERKQETLGKPCPECGCELVKRSGKFGVFYGCLGYESGCKVTASEEGEFRKPQKAKKTGKKCSKCKKGDMLERKNKKTGEKFYGCSAFPRCRNVESATS